MPETTTPTGIQGLIFPYPTSQERLHQYEYYNRIFEGKHFEAFAIKIDNEKYGKEYAKLRYITCNFGALISKICADMLFSETPKITVQDGDQEWVDGLIEENKLHIQNYESALSNSAAGDALYKARIGKRSSIDEKMTIMIEDTSPSIYFPQFPMDNFKAEPEIEEIAWTFEDKMNNRKFLRKEIHTPGKIENKLYEMKGDQIEVELNINELGPEAPAPIVPTGVDFNLLWHIPNWKTNKSAFGVSDYSDISSLIYAANNRITKVDNILDKHSDPILAIPEGVLDKEGKVKRSQLHMFEVPAGSKEKPEYVVWNASLENAFKEIEKIVEFLMMFSETAPDLLGMGQGQSDSGRALKLKLMRTIAKVARKRLYYDRALKDMIYELQILGKVHGIEFNGKALQGEPVRPEIEWFDGLPIDQFEQMQLEEMKLNAGVTTEKDSIMRLEGVDEETAEKMVEEITESKSLKMAEMGFNNVQEPDAKESNQPPTQKTKPKETK